MTPYVSPEKEDRIVELCLCGYTRNEIAKKVHASGETVSRHMNQFMSRLSEKASEQLENLIQLSRELRESRKTLPEALETAHLCANLEKLNVRPDELGHFISSCKNIAKSLGAEATNYANAAIRLAKLEADTGKKHEDIIKDYEDKVKTVNRLSNEIDDLQKKERKSEEQFEKQMRESKNKLQEQMRENRLKEEDLNCAHDLKRILAPHGLDIDDAVLVPRLIKYVQESHMNPAVVLSKIKSIDSLSNTISTLKQDITASKRQLEDTQSKLAKAEKQIMAIETRKRELEDTLEKLRRSIDERTLAVEKLEDKSEKLTRESELKEGEIMMTDCLCGALLTNKPSNIDALYYCASELKNAKSLPQEKLLAHRKNYEPQVKELLKNAFLSEFSNEFTSNKDHQTVIENWKKAVKENRLLREQVEKQEKESTESKNTREKLEQQIKELQKEIDIRDELYAESHPPSLQDG